MPTFRSDIASIPRYVPGRPIDEVARELGIASIDKLASNECPVEPFPEVLAAIAAGGAGLNRYPDSAGYELTRAIAEHHGVPPEAVWIGAGSSEILRCTALSVGGPGTSAVFAHPSFVMYTIGTKLSHAEAITVPLDTDLAHDLDAMADAIRPDTTLVYVCNPNNPTGGIRSGVDVRRFVESVPERVTVIIDEAYAEYVTDANYASFLDASLQFPNVLVARTFSKIYGLAGLRIGFGVGDPSLVGTLRTSQAPFTVGSLAQVGALEALRHPARLAERRDDNHIGRRFLAEGLGHLGYRPASSEANFVYFEPDVDPAELADALLHRGEIVRVLGKGIRVTVGTDDENHRFLEAMRAIGTTDA